MRRGRRSSSTSAPTVSPTQAERLVLTTTVSAAKAAPPPHIHRSRPRADQAREAITSAAMRKTPPRVRVIPNPPVAVWPVYFG